MKKIIYLFAFIFVLTSCGDDPFSKVKSENVKSAAVRDNTPFKYPVMSFDRKVHDFGTIDDGVPQETVFSYTNTGEAPLVISDIKSTCGCTVPQDWSRAPLLPGESSKFTVKFNGKGANRTTKTVTINANTQNGSESVRIIAFINKSTSASKPTGSVIQ
tara:strand:+ start:3578 stop:4054 length:477 start_codon:yes stop_codon:yes gene_type:complete